MPLHTDIHVHQKNVTSISFFGLSLQLNRYILSFAFELCTKMPLHTDIHVQQKNVTSISFFGLSLQLNRYILSFAFTSILEFKNENFQ